MCSIVLGLGKYFNLNLLQLFTKAAFFFFFIYYYSYIY